MKNPLSRRLLRELRQDIGKYIALFLFLMLTTGFISGFLVADGSMVRAYDESFEKYDIAINYYTLTSRNLLRLYIPENILSIKPYVFESLSAPDAKTIYNGAAEPSVHFSSSPEIYVYRELYEKIKSKHADCLDEEGSTDCPSCPWILETFVPANVAFMNNYSAAVNRGYFRAEDLSLIHISEPTRPY